MNDITDLFRDLLVQYRSIDFAHTEFTRMLDDDEDLKAEYREWCEDNGYTEKRGFLIFCDEYMDSQDSIWETLNDYDE